jgi:hypothetical protein
MARIAKPLTDTEIRQAKPKEKEYSLADQATREGRTGHQYLCHPVTEHGFIRIGDGFGSNPFNQIFTR